MDYVYEATPVLEHVMHALNVSYSALQTELREALPSPPNVPDSTLVFPRAARKATTAALLKILFRNPTHPMVVRDVPVECRVSRRYRGVSMFNTPHEQGGVQRVRRAPVDLIAPDTPVVFGVLHFLDMWPHPPWREPRNIPFRLGNGPPDTLSPARIISSLKGEKGAQFLVRQFFLTNVLFSLLARFPTVLLRLADTAHMDSTFSAYSNGVLGLRLFCAAYEHWTHNKVLALASAWRFTQRMWSQGGVEWWRAKVTACPVDTLTDVDTMHSVQSWLVDQGGLMFCKTLVLEPGILRNVAYTILRSLVGPYAQEVHAHAEVAWSDRHDKQKIFVQQNNLLWKWSRFWSDTGTEDARLATHATPSVSRVKHFIVGYVHFCTQCAEHVRTKYAASNGTRVPLLTITNNEIVKVDIFDATAEDESGVLLVDAFHTEATYPPPFLTLMLNAEIADFHFHCTRDVTRLRSVYTHLLPAEDVNTRPSVPRETAAAQIHPILAALFVFRPHAFSIGTRLALARRQMPSETPHAETVSALMLLDSAVLMADPALRPPINVEQKADATCLKMDHVPSDPLCPTPSSARDDGEMTSTDSDNSSCLRGRRSPVRRRLRVRRNRSPSDSNASTEYTDTSDESEVSDDSGSITSTSGSESFEISTSEESDTLSDSSFASDAQTSGDTGDDSDEGTQAHKTQRHGSPARHAAKRRRR